MSILKRTHELIELGRTNTVLSIPTRIDKLDDFIYGTRQGCYYLYGGETGTGKTTLAREIHMHTPYEFFKSIGDESKLDVHFVDFSLEISAEMNMGAAIVRKIYQDYGTVLPAEQIFRWNKKKYGPLSNEAMNLIHSYDEHFQDFERKLTVVDEETTPTLFHDVLMEVAKKHGKFSKEGRWVSDCGVYTPNNPRLYVIVIIDTVNLADVEPGNEYVKASIDRISRLCVWFRNKCNFTPIVIQQFNAEISAVDRSRYGITTPLLRDFEDSKRTTKDANIVLGLYDPQRHMKDENTMFRGYDIMQLKSWFRSLHLLKNRNGQPNKIVPLKFAGATGTFTQLPEAEEMGPEQYNLATRY